ncbi:MAG: CoA transferase [Lachnospiraceae bacterium]|nr:CoA transferase [Lachnospiraceae bacterium]
MQSTMRDTLKGIKVVAFVRAMAGTAAAKVLAEYGAEVFFVEPVKGHPLRKMHYFEISHGYFKSIPINPRDKKGLELMHKLIADSDVFISNYRPNAIKAMGLSYEECKEKYPKLIHATLTGYGEDGPAAAEPGFDITAFWGRSGLTHDSMEKGGTPIEVPSAMGDIYAGMALGLGCVAALYKRNTTGKGEKVTTSLYANGLYANHCQIVDYQFGVPYPKDRKDNGRALKNSFQCKDGWFQAMTLSFEKDFDNFLRVVGREDLIGNPKWQKMEDTYGENAKELTAIFDEAFANMTCEEAIAKFNQYDIAVGPYYHGDFCLTDEQAKVNNYLMTVTEHMSGKEIQVPRFPVQFGEHAEYEDQPFSTLGGDTAEIMKRYGYSDAEIEEMAASGAVVVDKK